MSSQHDTTLSALSSTTPTGTDMNDKGIGSGSETQNQTTTQNTQNTQNTQTNPTSMGDSTQNSGYQTTSQSDPKKNPVQGLGAGMGQTGESVGQGARDLYHGVHGAGESLRGALNGAVDKAFGSSQGVEKNQAIVDKGEKEMSGR